MSEREIETKLPVEDTEAAGEGMAMGAAVGAAMGVAGGSTLGAAALSLLVPGVGPVLVGGLLGATILGLGGTVSGMAVGEALDEALTEGLPHDDLYVYEHALREGRSVVVAFLDGHEDADRVRQSLSTVGAQSIDSERENWWSSLREEEQSSYNRTGRDFTSDEVSYRRGFEAGQYSELLSRRKGAVVTQPDDRSDEAYRLGFERGLKHQQALNKRYNS
jgi:hypothetical protein